MRADRIKEERKEGGSNSTVITSVTAKGTSRFRLPPSVTVLVR